MPGEQVPFDLPPTGPPPGSPPSGPPVGPHLTGPPPGPPADPPPGTPAGLPESPLSEAEGLLWEAFPRGETVDLRTGDATEDDPARGDRWGPERTVRADMIATLLLGAVRTDPGRPPAVRLTGARITGRLDLSFTDVPHAALLQHCHFTEAPHLQGARTRLLNLYKSRFPGLTASDATIDGLLWLHGCHIEGPLRLTGARMEATVSLRHAHLSGRVYADSLTVAGDMAWTGASVRSEVFLRGTRIGGAVMLDGARLERPGGVALYADGLRAQGGLFCHDGFTADGEVRLPDTRIGRTLTFCGARLRNAGGTALRADGLVVDGTVNCQGLRALGEVTLHRAQVAGHLDVQNAEFRNPGGVALSTVLATVGGGIYGRSLVIDGELQLTGAQVTGPVVLRAADLNHPGGVAVRADRLRAVGGIIATDGFTAQGEVRLVDARIEAGAHFEGARLRNPRGRVLTGRGLTAGAVVNCCDGFTADGVISLVDARVTGEVCFSEATISARESPALRLRNLQAQALRMEPSEPIQGGVDLRHARLGLLRDDPALWPAALLLDGLTYDTLETPLPAAERVRWLSGLDGYQPQPYEQLAAAYRRLGHDADARTVLSAKHRRRRATLPWWGRVWSFLQEWTVGYGYRPQRAAAWLVALVCVGAVAFALRHPPPLNPGEAPRFNALLYALDLLLPIVSFGQEGAFDPRGWQQWLAAGLTAAGWVLATTIAAGVTRVLSRT